MMSLQENQCTCDRKKVTSFAEFIRRYLWVGPESMTEKSIGSLGQWLLIDKAKTFEQSRNDRLLEAWLTVRFPAWQQNNLRQIWGKPFVSIYVRRCMKPLDFNPSSMHEYLLKSWMSAYEPVIDATLRQLTRSMVSFWAIGRVAVT